MQVKRCFWKCTFRHTHTDRDTHTLAHRDTLTLTVSIFHLAKIRDASKHFLFAYALLWRAKTRKQSVSGVGREGGRHKYLVRFALNQTHACTVCHRYAAVPRGERWNSSAQGLTSGAASQDGIAFAFHIQIVFVFLFSGHILFRLHASAHL